VVDKTKIEGLLAKYFTTTGTITIDDLGLVSCSGNVELKRQWQFTQLPVRFEKVDGSFSCDRNTLQSLEGSPRVVGGSFICMYNYLSGSLKGGPTQVGRNYVCSGNQLGSLEGAPESVGGNFNCNNNLLESLSGAPQKVWSFNCGNNQLESLEGAPSTVADSFHCRDNRLKNLVGAPAVVPVEFDCIYNPLRSLDGLPQEIGTKLFLTYKKTLPLLRCLVAEKGVGFFLKSGNLQKGDAQAVALILNRYKAQGEAGAFQCGADLAAAGFKPNARW